MDSKKSFQNTLLLIIIGIVVYCAIQNYTVVFKLFGYIINLLFPFLLGGVIAFIINVPMRGIEKRLLPNCEWFKPFRRGVSYIITLLLLIGIFVLALFVIIPEVSNTIKIIIKQVPVAFNAFQTWIYSATANLPNVQSYLDDLNINWSTISTHAITIIKTAGTTLFSSSISIVSGIIGGITTFVIAFVFSIYLILQKEKLGRQTKQVLFSALSRQRAERIVYIGRLSDKIFSSFLSGQCIEAVILGTMFFITLSIFKLPYALLIGVVIAITALIPIFGAFIGCFIGAFLIVMVNPMQALWFILIFLILQQVEGNLIYPYVVGGSIGLPSIWVLAAVSVGGSLFGVAGILIFIPLCSVLYSLMKDAVHKRLAAKNIGPDIWDAKPAIVLEEEEPQNKKREKKEKRKKKEVKTDTDKEIPHKE